MLTQRCKTTGVRGGFRGRLFALLTTVEGGFATAEALIAEPATDADLQTTVRQARPFLGRVNLSENEEA